MSAWTAYNMPHLHNLEWDSREEHEVDFPHSWVIDPIVAAAAAFLETLVAEPPIKPGTPAPYTPPRPGDLRSEEHLQVSPIIHHVTSLVRAQDGDAPAAHGLRHAAG
jgi:arylsulfatase